MKSAICAIMLLEGNLLPPELLPWIDAMLTLSGMADDLNPARRCPT